jgi:alpha-glucosidase
MPWTDAAHGGFTRAAPWLPVPAQHLSRNVLRQEGDAQSPLQRFRRFLRWRKQHPALIAGDIRMLPGPEPVLVFDRVLDGGTIRAWFNTASRDVVSEAPASARVLEGHGLVAGTLQGTRVSLPAYGVLFATIA